MRRPILGAVAALLLVLPALVAPGAPAATAALDPIVVAVIDTGIDASHAEFAAGQIIAWRDFTSENSPVPVDPNGHGTATASLVAGRNVGDCGGTSAGDQKLSFAPGAPLVVARVGTADGTIEGDITAAFVWATDLGADVISMSIGGIVPFPISGNDGIKYARDRGVLVVVSAGNGVANLGLVPYPGWSTAYGNDPNALMVGAGTRAGTTVTSVTGNMDPDVTSWGVSTCVALTGGGYGKMGGTSFAAPLVAGMGAKAMEISRANGRVFADEDERIERLLLLSAKNNVGSPYLREGMGWLLTSEWQTIAAHAAAGTLPNYDAQGEHARQDRIYHDNVVETLRRTQTIV